MFTGIVEAVGLVADLEKTSPQGTRIWIGAPFKFKETVRPGESIAVNGACLTVRGCQERYFWANLSPETLEKSYFLDLKEGDSVNLERPLQFPAQVHGHLVSGHIDGVGTVNLIEKVGEFTKFVFKLHKSLISDLVLKGSIAIDGISLTVNRCENDEVEVMVIPHTLKYTTLGDKKVGDKIQVELDLIGKYVKKWMKPYEDHHNRSLS